MLVKPDALAMSTPIKVVFRIGKDFVTSHNMTRIRTEFEFIHIPGGIHTGRFHLLRWHIFVFCLPPVHIGIGVDPHASTI